MDDIQKIEDNHGQIAQNVSGDQIYKQINNFYSSIIFKSLQIKKDELKIRVFHNYINKIDLSRLIFSAFLSSFFVVGFFIYYIGFEPNIIEFLQSVVFVFFILSIFFTAILFFMRYFPSLHLIIHQDSTGLEQKNKEDIIIKYDEIRSILKMKDLVGYSIYIYKKDELYPYISFNTECVHTANAVEQLIINKVIV